MTLTTIHASADVHPHAHVGLNCRIWHQAQIRENATLGDNCIIGKNVYIDFDVVIGNNVKIQNNALIYHGVTLDDGVFIGPRACLTNDRTPRAIMPDGALKTDDDWVVGSIHVHYGASIGAGAIILPDVTIGRFAMIAAGAVVTNNVPDHGLVIGIPARLTGYVCACGHRLQLVADEFTCAVCSSSWNLPPILYSSETEHNSASATNISGVLA